MSDTNCKKCGAPMGAGKLTCEFCGHKAETGSGGAMSQVDAKRIKKIRKKIKEEYAIKRGGSHRMAVYNYVKGKSFFWRFFKCGYWHLGILGWIGKSCELDHEYKCVNFCYNSGSVRLEAQLDDYVRDNNLWPYSPDFPSEQEFAKQRMAELLEEQELYGSNDILVDDEE
jgi:hypothetical protein